MKILMEDSITKVIASNLSEYQHDLSQHKPSLMRNDYPTAQWIAGLPQGVEDALDNDNNPTGRKVSARILADGVSSMNGIYLGNFIGDAINYKVYEIDEVNNNEVLIGEADVPIRVFNSFGHFIRGLPNSYQDYLYTLKELGFQKEYLYNAFRVECTVSSEINLLVESNNVKFEVQSLISLTHIDNIDTVPRRYWKMRGYFKDSSNNRLAIDSIQFDEPIHVGMIFMCEFDNDMELDSNGDPTTNQSTRLCQITEILGTGIKDNAISVLVRDYETAGVEETIEDRTSPVTTFVDELINNKVVSISDYQDTGNLTYLFRSMRVGLLRAGYVEHFPNPQVGLSRTYKDYSIRKSLINGGHQYSNRNIAKIYSGQLVLDRDRVRRFLTFVEAQKSKAIPQLKFFLTGKRRLLLYFMVTSLMRLLKV